MKVFVIITVYMGKKSTFFLRSSETFHGSLEDRQHPTSINPLPIIKRRILGEQKTITISRPQTM